MPAQAHRLTLSDQQIRFFRDVGYLRLTDAFNCDCVGSLRSAVIDALQFGAEPVRRDANGRPIRISRIFERASVFREALTSAALLEPLSSLLGPNIEFVNNRHNHATIDAGQSKASRLHRDVLQWSRPIVTVVIYLDDADDGLGCTRVVPASQYLPFVGTPNNGGSWMDEHGIFRDLVDQAVLVPVRAGDVLILDGLIFHAADASAQLRDRIVVTAAYHSVDELNRPQDDGTRTLVRGERIFRGDS